MQSERMQRFDDTTVEMRSPKAVKEYGKAYVDNSLKVEPASMRVQLVAALRCQPYSTGRIIRLATSSLFSTLPTNANPTELTKMTQYYHQDVFMVRYENSMNSA